MRWLMSLFSSRRPAIPAPIQLPQYEQLLQALADVQIRSGALQSETWDYMRTRIQSYALESPERAYAQMAATMVLRNVEIGAYLLAAAASGAEVN